VLAQLNESGEERPIAVSQLCLTVVLAIKKFRMYIEGQEFKGLYTFFIFKKSKIFLLLYLKEQFLENIFPNFHRDSSSRKKVNEISSDLKTIVQAQGITLN